MSTLSEYLITIEKPLCFITQNRIYIYMYTYINTKVLYICLPMYRKRKNLLKRLKDLSTIFSV